MTISYVLLSGMRFWREAATVILAMRPSQKLQSTVPKVTAALGVSDVQENDYHVLTLRRSVQHSFMPSKVVFPGGTIHDCDYTPEWKDIYKKIAGCSLQDITNDLNTTDCQVPMIKAQRDWTIHADIAFRICAIRETFEESGILLATNRQLLAQESNTRFTK